MAKFGIALEWGSRGLEFESQHSDQKEVLPETEALLFSQSVKKVCHCEPVRKLAWQSVTNNVKFPIYYADFHHLDYGFPRRFAPRSKYPWGAPRNDRNGFFDKLKRGRKTPFLFIKVMEINGVLTKRPFCTIILPYACAHPAVTEAQKGGTHREIDEISVRRTGAGSGAESDGLRRGQQEI